MTAGGARACLLTAPARGGIAVIVLEGAQARMILDGVFRPRRRAPRPGLLSLGWIVREGEILDEAVVASGRAGEDWVEINIHGGPHVARKVLGLLAERGAEIVPGGLPDPALAVPRRGLRNPAIGREMLGALALAGTPLAASAVTAQWSGGLSVLAVADEPDRDRLREAAGGLVLMDRLLHPAEVVIAGPPSVGKSALTNALVGRNVSIVHDRPPTTRDWVRARAEADGVPIWVTDTAGLCQPGFAPEQRGFAPADPGFAPEQRGFAVPGRDGQENLDLQAVRRAWERIASADLVLCVTAGAPAPAGRGLLERLRACPSVLNVSGKCDAVPADVRADLAVSARTLRGLDDLRRAIRARLGFAGFDPSAARAFTPRQHGLLTRAAEAFERGDRPAGRVSLDELLAGA